MTLVEDLQKIHEKAAHAQNLAIEASNDLASIQRRIIAGETLGDRLKDFVFMINMGNADSEERVRHLEQRLRGKTHEWLIMQIEYARDDEHSLSGKSESSDFFVGLISEDKLTLKYKSPHMGFSIDYGASINLPRNPKHPIHQAYSGIFFPDDLAVLALINPTDFDGMQSSIRFKLLKIGNEECGEWLMSANPGELEIIYDLFSAMGDVEIPAFFRDRLSKIRADIITNLEDTIAERDRLRDLVEGVVSQGSDNSGTFMPADMQRCIFRLRMHLDLAIRFGLEKDPFVAPLLERYKRTQT